MKKKLTMLAVLVMVLCISVIGYAAPFLTTNPQAGITSYVLTGSSWVPSTAAALSDGSLKLDVAGSSVGVNTVNISACSSNDAVWGVLCSAPVPFTFTRPAVPSAPTGMALIP